MLLCPLRALRYYHKKRAHYLHGCWRLFISTGRIKKCVPRSTIAFWLSAAINHTYQLATNEDATTMKQNCMKCIVLPLLFPSRNMLQSV